MKFTIDELMLIILTLRRRFEVDNKGLKDDDLSHLQDLLDKMESYVLEQDEKAEKSYIPDDVMKKMN